MIFEGTMCIYNHNAIRKYGGEKKELSNVDCLFVCLFVCLMVFSATFNNILVISWRSILLVKENRGPGENHLLVANHWKTLPHNVVHLALVEIQSVQHYVVKFVCDLRHVGGFLRVLRFDKNKNTDTHKQAFQI